MKRGVWYGLGAYATWGLFPVYWKWLQHVPALQLAGHRFFWSFFTLLILILFTKKWRSFRREAFTNRILLIYSGASILIGINWLTYVWAINAGYIVETSLGYFINPLFSVLLGVIFLHERLRRWQWLPVGLAAAGVLFLAFVYGNLPWIALVLAISFGLYGLIKKTAPLGSVFGLTLETGILLLPVTIYLFYSEMTGQGSFLHAGLLSDILLVGAGLVTTIPLLMFASASKRIPLSLLGVLQYLAPTLQFILGVLIYGESFTYVHLIGYGMVWIALIIFALEGYFAYRTKPAIAVIE